MTEGKLKILMLNHEFPPVGGGASPVTYEMCKQLARLGHHVDVVTMHYGNTPRFESVDGFNVYRTPAIRRKPDICHTHELATYLPGALFKTLRLARKHKYDIIHCHFIVPDAPLAWLVSRLTKIPFVVTCHGSDVPGYNPDRFGLVHKVIMPAWRFLVKHSDMLISPSMSLKKLIESKCPSVEVQVVPNGIYSSAYESLRKKKKILLCSRLLPRKGFQYVIEALKDKDIGWEVDVIGEGPFRGELEKRAENSKTAIKFWGWLDQGDEKSVELYKDAAIFVFPSEAENFPTVLLEAMSAGMAVVTSTAGGCPEVVGDAGLLVAPRDVEGIREAILKLIQDEDYRKLKAEESLRQVEKFNWSIVAERYLKCYQSVMESVK